MKPLSETVTTQKLADTFGIRWRHLPKATRRMMLDFVMTKQSDDRKTLEEAFRVCKEKRTMQNQYGQESAVTEIPTDQLQHIATCDGWHSKDRQDALAEIGNRNEFEAGHEAFFADDDHLLYQCTPEFLEGYKEAFFQHAPKSQMDPHGEHVEEYWKAHYSEAVTTMRERLLNAVLGVGSAVIVAGLFMAAAMLDNADVAAFWGGLR